jgi:signal transduction histidine kinase/ActR/RegA family two-component response regulator
MKGMELPGRTIHQTRSRFERFNIVVAILLAGWVPSMLMLWVAYTILTRTLETKILRDRQTLVQLIAHLVDDDLVGKSTIIEYYQTLSTVANNLTDPNQREVCQRWIDQTYFSHPRIDGMFITDTEGRLIASVPAVPDLIGQDFYSVLWREGALTTPGVYISQVHPREPDHRVVSDIVGAVRTPDKRVVGFLGVSVLVERIGRRLSTIRISDQSNCQVFDQNGAALFAKDFSTNPTLHSPVSDNLIAEIRKSATGHVEQRDKLYSFSPVGQAGWTTVVEQPRAEAYQPVQDLLGKLTVPVAWLIAGTALAAWLFGKFYRRQTEAARRIEREVIFNEKILANMPSGIALVDPGTKDFLIVNEAFAEMAKRFGQLPENRDINEASFDEVKIAPSEAIDKVLTFGAPFQLIEHPLTDRNGTTRYVNVNLLRLQGAQQTIQGVLYLVEDKTRDVTLRKELIGANAAKDQFLALLSHELRNPLSPVIAMVSELEAANPDSPDTRHALEVIRRNVELEARLIDDLLDITRIAKGKLQLTFEVTNVHEVLRRAYEICRDEIDAKSQQPEFRLRAERFNTDADPARLQQVFWNLIKNAVKFTPEEGRIVIETFNPIPDKIEIKVTDSGIGIDEERLGKVFNAFEQGQSSITRRFGGLGLGLAISKTMVAAHGGEIIVQSDGKDKGTTFTVTLNTVDAPAGLAEEKPRELEPVSTKLDGESRRRHVLVVDDHEDTCLGMKMMLERRGYQISVAHSADQAVNKVSKENFDLIISDIGLPDRSGYELMQELRATKGLPGIALSGFGMENDVMRARAAGFSEHLTKPINFERLEQAIQKILQPDGTSQPDGSSNGS